MKITLFTNHSGGNAAIKRSGIGRYSASLYSALRNEGYDVELTEPAEVPKIIQFLGKIMRKDMKTVWKSAPLKFPTGEGILHCTAQTLALPLIYSKRTCVVTVHDIIPLATKEYASLMEKGTYFLLKYALKKATHIIADSAHTKKDIIKYVSYPEEKITVVHLGIDQKMFKEKKGQRLNNTLLYVGSDAKRKNIALIIRALVYVKKEFPDIKFIKVGQAQDNAMRQKLKALARELKVEENIIWKDYVEDIAEEYSKATAFVFPSIYEGFGFPILEAMACGCPVICSNKTSLPELGGDAVLYTSAEDEKALAERIIQLLKSKNMQEKLRKKGKAQVKKFTWERCAQETMQVYERVN